MSLLLLLSIGLGNPSASDAAAPDVLDAAQFGAKGDRSDATPAIRAALEKARQFGAKKLVFAAGRYDFWPDAAAERQIFETNNDSGVKRIAFDLHGLNGFEIDGQQAQLVFHGFVSPFILDHSKNIVLRNFSIDWARTFHSEARIQSVLPDGIDLQFSEDFPYEIEQGKLRFIDDRKVEYPTAGLLEFDAQKRETAWQVSDTRFGANATFTDAGGRTVHVATPKFKATVGNILVFGASRRYCSAISISDSEGVLLDHVTIYHAGGMGVIAQRSRNITVSNVQVTPGAGRILSATADATHFANCSGKIVLTHDLFENQLDDATNIHGIYARIEKKVSDDTIEVKLVHAQQAGMDFIVPGMQLELVHAPNLVTYGQREVKNVERLDATLTRVTLTEPLPPEMETKDVVAQVGAYPQVQIDHCTIRNNRARGILLGSRAKTVVEENTFHTPGAAILLEGDGRFWFEQSGVRDLVISHNLFLNCNYGVWGNAVIQVGTGIDPKKRSPSRYHRNISIEDNTFRVFDARLLNVYCVDGLIWRRNKVEPSTDYPAQNQQAKAFVVADSDNVRVEP